MLCESHVVLLSRDYNENESLCARKDRLKARAICNEILRKFEKLKLNPMKGLSTSWVAFC